MADKITVQQAVTQAYHRGYRAGFLAAKGPPPKDNRCHKNWPFDTNCYLSNGHKGPCKPWPHCPVKEPTNVNAR